MPKKKNKKKTGAKVTNGPPIGFGVSDTEVAVGRYMSAVLYPFSTTSAQIPDASLFPSTPLANKITWHPTLQTATNLSFYGHSLVFLGSGDTTMKHTQSINATTGVIDWSTGSVTDAENLSNAWTRPLVVGLRVTVIALAEASRSRATMMAVPIHPQSLSSVGAAPTAWPTKYDAAMTSCLQRSGAKMFNLGRGESVELYGVPLDPRAYHYEVSTAERDTDALTGYIVLLDGFESSDRVEVTLVYKSESISASPSTGEVFTEKTRPPVKPGVVDSVLDGLSEAASAGYTAVKGAVAGVAEEVRSYIVREAQMTAGDIIKRSAGQLIDYVGGGLFGNPKKGLPAFSGGASMFGGKFSSFEPLATEALLRRRFLLSAYPVMPRTCALKLLGLVELEEQDDEWLQEARAVATSGPPSESSTVTVGRTAKVARSGWL